MPLHENPMPTPVSPRAEGVTDPGELTRVCKA